MLLYENVGKPSVDAPLLAMRWQAEAPLGVCILLYRKTLEIIP